MKRKMPSHLQNYELETIVLYYIKRKLVVLLISFLTDQTNEITNHVPVVRKVVNAFHRINHYPADSVVCFVNTYQLDNDLSGG